MKVVYLKLLICLQHNSDNMQFKARVHCFSMLIVMKKCFLYPEKFRRKFVLSFSRKTHL